MTFGSRQKGSRAELEVAKLLQDWWRQIEPGCVFRRTPGSGAWGRGKENADFEVGGDLCTTAKRFPWCVEIKRREGWSWKPLLQGKQSPVLSWWTQAVVAAAESGKSPVLIFRHAREPWWCLFDKDFRFGDISIGLRVNPHPVRLIRMDELMSRGPERFALPG